MHWPQRDLRHTWPLAIVFVAAQALATDQVAEIEFFGYKGLDMEALSKAVSLHKGGQSRNVQKLDRFISTDVVTGRSLSRAATFVSLCC
jgi:hypothetical protein